MATKQEDMTPKEVKAVLKELNSVESKLLEIQTRLFVPKGQRNEFGKYDYRSCEDIEKAVKPLCLEYNCTLTLQTFIEEYAGRLFVKATACLYDNEINKGVVANGYAEIGENKKGMDQAQLTGAATSYARKYALAGLFLIDNEKDADATNKHGKDSKEEEVHDTINATQMNAIYAELERTGIAESVILDSVKKKAVQDITQEEYVGLMKRLNASSDK
jgi:hypothetical protein